MSNKPKVTSPQTFIAEYSPKHIAVVSQIERLLSSQGNSVDRNDTGRYVELIVYNPDYYINHKIGNDINALYQEAGWRELVWDEPESAPDTDYGHQQIIRLYLKD